MAKLGEAGEMKSQCDSLKEILQWPMIAVDVPDGYELFTFNEMLREECMAYDSNGRFCTSTDPRYAPTRILLFIDNIEDAFWFRLKFGVDMVVPAK